MAWKSVSQKTLIISLNAITKFRRCFDALFTTPCATQGTVPRLIYAMMSGGLCLAFVIIGFRICDQVNHDPSEFDQSAYLAMAQKMQGAWWPWYNDGTRNPLFPWLAEKTLDIQTSDFFEKGKKFNVVLGAVGTALLAIFFCQRVSALAAFNATTLVALAVLLPLTTFFGAEPIFYIFFFFLWVCAARLLQSNPIALYGLLGIVAGVGYLAKPSTTPILGLFFLFSLGRLVLHWWGNDRLPSHLRASSWSPRRFIIGSILTAAVFTALCVPRFVHSQRTWGNMFYSLPEFWFWLDDWQTCVERYYDCRKVKLDTMSPEEQPTLLGYFRRHTIADAVHRTTRGTIERLRQFFQPESKFRIPYDKIKKSKRVILPHRGIYLLALAILATLLLVFVVRERRFNSLGIMWPLLFSGAVFATYTFISAWYLPIGPGHRFMLTLYLPAVWLLVQGGDHFQNFITSRLPHLLFAFAHIIIAILLTSRIAILLVDGNFQKISYAF